MGMRQRLGVASCLLADPELLILDEPMNGLDPAGMHEMRAMIHSLVDEGRTVMLSSHLLDEVERTCDAVAIVDRGRVVRQGPIDELVRGAARPSCEVACSEPARAARVIDEAASSRARRSASAGLTVTLPPGASARWSPNQPAAGRRRHLGLRPAGGAGHAGGLVPVRDEPTGRRPVTSLAARRRAAAVRADPRRGRAGTPRHRVGASIRPGTSSPPSSSKSASGAG